MTTIVPEGVTPTGERLERVIENVGTVVFENYGPGEWMTKAGKPAKTSRRRYLLDGEVLDSVSSIVDALRKEGLERWIETEATRGAVLAERMGELADVPEEDWAARVKALGLGATAKRDEAADRGTIIHAAGHALTEGHVPNPAEFPEAGRPWVQGMMRAWLALAPSEIVAAEQIVCNPVHLYAGRPDLVAVVDGRVTLVDYKSGKGRIYDSAHFQARLYAMALRHCGVEVERIVLVGIDDAGGFQLVECAATEKAAEALIAVHRARKAINADMAAQRRIARAA
ncbi:MAG TPA: PD-(D/E)XK nuclease family protein [Solirubrobacteraceae bacterium]|nr:PD-(D/E)XK nuclease family protein [Solirubrobacteraceae bacterium]